MLNIIGWIVIGFISGAVANWFMGVHMTWIMTTLLGIAGSFAGGFIGGMFTKEKDMLTPRASGFIMSIIGAMALIFVASRLGLSR